MHIKVELLPVCSEILSIKSEGKVGSKVKNQQLSLIGMFGFCGAAASHQQHSGRLFSQNSQSIF